MKKEILVLVVCGLFTMLCCSSCHNHSHTDGHEMEEHHHDDDDMHMLHPDDIILEPEKAAAAGIETSSVEKGIFHDVIQTSGKILAASCDESTIVATVSGIVSHAQHISEGMAISKGTTIYTISSSNIQDGDQSQRAYIAYQIAKREYERMQPLAKDKIVSEKDFNAAKAEYESARIAYEAVSSNRSSKGVTIKTSTTGYIKDCLVKDGDYVEVGAPLMTITKNQHLYLRVEVPVRYYDSLNKVTSAKFRTNYSDETFDLQAMNGHLLSSGKSAESTSSYVPVTFQFDNRGDIVPGAYAEVFLVTGERQDVLTLPLTSLTEEQGVYYIYIKENEHSYHKQEVKLGTSDGERVEITEGLKGGENVVTKGAINVKIAAASKAIPGHSHNH